MKSIILKAHEVRRLASAGSVIAWRRLKEQPPEDCGKINCGIYHPTKLGRDGDEIPGPATFGAWSQDGDWACDCRYGATGETRWVKETWAQIHGSALREGDSVVYRADSARGLGWNSSSTMPRWASRFTVRITVDCLRIQSVTEERDGVRFNVGRDAWTRNEWFWAIECEKVEGAK